MRAALVIAKLAGQIYALKVLGKPAFKMLTAVILPIKLARQGFDGFLLAVGHIVEQVDFRDARQAHPRFPQRQGRIFFQALAPAVLAVDALEVPGVAIGMLQAEGCVRPFGGDVASIQNVFDPILACHLVNGRAEQVVLRHVQVGHAAEQVGALQLLHRGPVHYIGMQAHIQLLAHLFNVAHGHFAVPSAVHMHGQHAQPQLVCQIEHVGAVHPAREA